MNKVEVLSLRENNNMYQMHREHKVSTDCVDSCVPKHAHINGSICRQSSVLITI